MTLDFSRTLKDKKTIQKKIFREFSLPKNTRAVVLNLLSDENLRSQVTDACEQISVKCFKDLSEELLFGADAILCDEKNGEIFSKIPSHLLIPIVSKNFSEFEEFNPMKFEGNAFLFEKTELFPIFEKICRFLENGQYAGDRRTLLKNIFSTKIP